MLGCWGRRVRKVSSVFRFLHDMCTLCLGFGGEFLGYLSKWIVDSRRES